MPARAARVPRCAAGWCDLRLSNARRRDLEKGLAAAADEKPYAKTIFGLKIGRRAPSARIHTEMLISSLLPSSLYDAKKSTSLPL